MKRPDLTVQGYRKRRQRRAWRTNRRSTRRAAGAAVTASSSADALRPSCASASALGVELHAPGRTPPAHGVAGVVGIAGQHHGVGRRSQHALQVGGLHRHPQRQAGKQRISRGGGGQVDVDRAHFAAIRVVADLARKGVSEQLMAIADAQQRQAGLPRLAQPGGTALAPIQVLGHHRCRTRHQRAGKPRPFGQGLAVLDVDHDRGVAVQPGGHADPVGKAAVPAHRGGRVTGGQDQERWHVGSMGHDVRQRPGAGGEPAPPPSHLY